MSQSRRQDGASARAVRLHRARRAHGAARAARVLAGFATTATASLASGISSASENTVLVYPDVFDYIERFYNPRRPHSTLGQISPDQFEKTRATLRRVSVKSG